MEFNNYKEVPKKVKTIIAKDKDTVLLKYREFEKEHFVIDEKWCTDTMLIVFYWED